MATAQLEHGAGVRSGLGSRPRSEHVVGPDPVTLPALPEMEPTRQLNPLEGSIEIGHDQSNASMAALVSAISSAL